MRRWGLFTVIVLWIGATAFPAFGMNTETRKVQQILQKIPAAKGQTVWQVMQRNKIKLKLGQINEFPVAVPGKPIAAGDVHLDVFFDTLHPALRSLSRAATHDLHARFIKRNGSGTWVPDDPWAENLVNDKMPWKEKDW